MFQRSIENTAVATDSKPLVDGNLSCVLINATLNYERLNASPGLDFNDAIAQVTVFYGWNAGDNLYTLLETESIRVLAEEVSPAAALLLRRMPSTSMAVPKAALPASEEPACKAMRVSVYE